LTDDSLIQDLMTLLAMIETDMTIFYRSLAHLDIDHLPEDFSKSDTDIQTFARPLMDAYYRPQQIDTPYREHLKSWLEQYARRIHSDPLSVESRRKKMNHTNPKYVLRNYLTQLAIEKAEQGDFSMIHELLEVMRHPYDEQPGKETFARKRPDWARVKPGCSMLSCSS
ncbi:MAG: YdiU family protein, partial [Proteobacteria bacterium]|nr:YdiU family protein [Pseudomonadota bacterium]